MQKMLCFLSLSLCLSLISLQEKNDFILTNILRINLVVTFFSVIIISECIKASLLLSLDYMGNNGNMVSFMNLQPMDAISFDILLEWAGGAGDGDDDGAGWKICSPS